MTFPDYQSKYPELGFYGLPGHTRTPRDLLKQVQDAEAMGLGNVCLLYTSPSPRDATLSRMPSSA